MAKAEKGTPLRHLPPLRDAANALEALDITRAPEQAEAVWGLTTEALATAALLMDETAGWSMLYQNSDIPAK